MKELLGQHYDVNARSEPSWPDCPGVDFSPGVTPLHLAAEDGHAEVVKILLTHGADANARTRSGETPLARARSSAVVRVLIEAGASARAKDQWGHTPLHRLAYGSADEDAALMLVKAGADVNARAEEDITPLHSAVMAGNLPVIRVLLRHGATVNARTVSGSTPLFHVSNPYNGVNEATRLQMAELLVEYDADPGLGEPGTTAVDMAIIAGYAAVAKYLEAHIPATQPGAHSQKATP